MSNVRITANCYLDYPINHSIPLREPIRRCHRDGLPLESSPNSIPIEQVAMIKSTDDEDERICWKVQGCGYSWQAITTMRDIRFLHRVLFSSSGKPAGMVQQVPFDGSDSEVLKEVEQVLTNYKCLLVSGPVERVLKKEYTAFKSLSVC